MSSLYRENEGTLIAKLMNRVAALERRKAVAGFYEIKVFADDEEVEVGNGAFIFAIPIDLDRARLRYANAFLTTSGSGDTEVMIHNIGVGTDMLSSPITIDSGELNAETSASPVVIKTSDFFVNYPDTDATVYRRDQIRIDVDSVGSGAMGLGVMLGFDA